VNLEHFLETWRARRDEFQRLGALVRGDALCDQVLNDLAAVHVHHGDPLLTLTEAADRSGYSIDHLGRLIRDGTIPNAGRPGAPRIRRGDLPQKPGTRVAAHSQVAYDAGADARKLVSRRKGGP
jgi:hypothetical protein